MTVFELGGHTPLIVWVSGARGMGRSTKGIVEFLDLYPPQPPLIFVMGFGGFTLRVNSSVSV